MGLLLLTLATLAACSPGDEAACVAPEPPSTEPQAISFGVKETEAQTRGKLQLTNTTIWDQDFAVYAVYTGQKTLAEAAGMDYYFKNHVFDNTEKVSDTGDDSEKYLWHGVSPVYWPLEPTDKLTFFAYAPKDVTLQQFRFLEDDDIAELKKEPRYDELSVAKTIAADYFPDFDDPTNQLDLCLAKPVIDRSYKKLREANTGVEKPSIPLSFQHTLCYIEIYARYLGSIDPTMKAVIDEVTISNVVNHGILMFNTDQDEHPSYTWYTKGIANAPAEEKATIILMRSTKKHLKDKGLFREDSSKPDGGYRKIQDSNGNLFLVPQTHSGGKMDIVFSYVKNNDSSPNADSDVGEPISQFSVQLDMPTVEWQPGHVVKYYLDVELGPTTNATLTAKDDSTLPPVAIDQWDNSGNKGGADDSNSDHVLK